MPYPSTTWHCSTCHAPHRSEDDAVRCEYGHIVDRAVAGFRDDLARIFSSSPIPKDGAPQ